MSSTFFTASPHWRWLIVAYFFLGGLAGGSYFLATLLDLFGKGRDRRPLHKWHLQRRAADLAIHHDLACR